MNIKSKYDAIIIGAGIGGLVCGCFLAQNKRKVLIVEKHAKPGGCITSIQKKECIFDMGGHLFGGCGKFGILNQCLTRLGIKVDFVRIDPVDQINFGNEKIQIPADLNKYIELLTKLFPEEKKGINAFFEKVLYFSRNFSTPTTLEKYKNLTYQEMLDSYFCNQKLKGILSSQYLYIGSKPKDASALFMSVLLSSYLKDGVYYPIGGTQVFSDAISRRFTEFGGEIILGRSVSKILIDKESNSAYAVELDSGKTILGEVIISNGDAINTMTNLVENRKCPDEYVEKVKKIEKSVALFLTFMAINAPKENLSNYRGWYFSSYDMNDQVDPLYIFIPTVFDDSLSPKGIQIIEALTVSGNQFSKANMLEGAKKTLQENIVARIKSIIKDVKDFDIHYIDSATPKTFQRYTSNCEGAAYGWAMIPSQTGVNRLQQETPVRNLYMVGHWTTPGCGVTSVAVSGWNLSKKVISKTGVCK